MNPWVCPLDRTPLPGSGAACVCPGCAREFRSTGGVPHFDLARGSREASAPLLDELWQAMQERPIEAAAQEFCRRHGLTREPSSSDWSGTIAVPAGGRVLEIGAGFGDDTLELARRDAEVVALVPSAVQARIVSRRLEGRPGLRVALAVVDDLGRLPLQDRSIDTIAMEEAAAGGFGLRDIGAVAAEWQRVLRPGGQLVLGLRNGLYRAPGMGRLQRKLFGEAGVDSLNRCLRRGAPGPGATALGLRRTLARLRPGFAPPAIMAPLPDPNGVKVVLPVRDPGVVGYCFNSLLRRNSAPLRAVAAAAHLAAHLGLLRTLVPYYFLTFERLRGGETAGGSAG